MAKKMIKINGEKFPEGSCPTGRFIDGKEVINLPSQSTKEVELLARKYSVSEKTMKKVVISGGEFSVKK